MKKDFLLRQEQRQPLRELYKWLGIHLDFQHIRMMKLPGCLTGWDACGLCKRSSWTRRQNSLGKERGDPLGFLRTEELIAAMHYIRADLGWLAENPEESEILVFQKL